MNIITMEYIKICIKCEKAFKAEEFEDRVCDECIEKINS